MRIGILSRAPKSYSTQRLFEAAEERGHEVRVLDYLRCTMDITSGKPRVFLREEALRLDGIIPRIGATYTFYGAAVVRQFEMMGTLTANQSLSIVRSRDKLRCLQILAREGVGLPQTCFAHSTKDIDSLLKRVGGAPVILKLLESTQGKGVVLAETEKAAESVMSAFRQMDANILVQHFVKEANGEDIRAFVVGNRVVASMLRKAAPGDFRSNLHRGGTAENVKLSKEERELAVKASKIMGLDVSGVDLLRTDRGPQVLEVNASPGLEGIEASSGKDIASEILKMLEKEKKSFLGKRRRKEA
jgi:ribosomal protein S6--L-glutamate ligase